MIYTRAHYYLLDYLACLLMLLVLPLFYSCSSDDDEIYGYDEEVIDGDYRTVDSIADGEKIILPVFLSSGLNASFVEAIENRITNKASSIDDGVVVVTDMAGLNSMDIADGTIVVVYKPSSNLFSEAEDAICVAFRKGGYGSCTIGHPSANMTVDECLNQLVEWINSSTIDSNDGEGMEEVYVSASYSGQLREQINKVLWSKPDSIIGDYAVNVKLNIQPMHGFASSNNSATDYYLVDCNVEVESGKMYRGNYTKKHGGVIVRQCGFYLRSLTAAISLLDSSDKETGRFVQVPSPETIAGSTSYTTGWSLSLGGNITAGTVPSLTSKLGFSISNSKKRDISDCDIVNRHRGASAIYDYQVNNLPSYNSAHMKINPPPAISTSTASFYSRWIWAVPTADKDSKAQYKCRIKLSNFVYGASYFYSSGADYHNNQYSIKDITLTKDMPIPNRWPTASVRLTNNVTGSTVTNIKFRNIAHTEYSDSSKSNQIAYKRDYSTYLRVGEYELTCKIKDANGNENNYKYDKNITVGEAGNINLVTSHGFVKQNTK